MEEKKGAEAEKGWRRLWIASVLAVIVLCMPAAVDFYRLETARREGDLPKALMAAKSLSESFFGPLFSPWLEEVTGEIRSEVVETNLLSIKRLVPDSEESAYAEMELGRLALNHGDAKLAAMHFERYLKSGLGRDVARAHIDLSESYRELKRYKEAAELLQVVLKGRISASGAPSADVSDIGRVTPEEQMEASFRLGEIYQFYLGRVQDAIPIYRKALQDTSTPGRWRNDILTNMALLEE